MKNIHKKLFLIRQEIGAITKAKTNPYFKSSYFDINILLEYLNPLLEKHGILILQPIIGDKLYTRIIDVDTAEEEAGYMELQQLEDAQKMGSLITYYRRYSLQSVFCIQANDDDGNEASKPVENPAAKSLTKEQFDKACLGTKEQIHNLLNSDKFKMKKAYREHLIKLV